MSVHLRDEINSSISEILSFLKKFESFNKNSKMLCEGSTIRTVVQTMIETLRTDLSPDRQIVDIILSHAVSAELSSPGGFDVFIDSIKSLLKRYCDPSIHTFSNVSSPMRPTKDIIDKYINFELLGIDETIKEMVKKSIELVGISGRISFEPTTSNKKSIELISGYNFEIEPAFRATCAFLDSRVIVIDGYIESVGEAHKLFQSVFDSKTPVALFVRGMSDEVLQTIKVNYERGTLMIVPFIVQLDVNHVNTLNDIAVASGGDILSTTKGELISTININDFPLVERIDIHTDSVTITCESSRISVNNHVKNILEKREKSFDEKNFEYSKLYDQRLKTLSQSRVIVRINETENVFYTQSVVDRIYRGIRSMSDHGYTVFNESQIIPYMAVHAGRLFAKRCQIVLNDIECVITRKKKNVK